MFYKMILHCSGYFECNSTIIRFKHPYYCNTSHTNLNSLQNNYPCPYVYSQCNLTDYFTPPFKFNLWL